LAGESELAKLVKHLNPELNEGEYVFVSMQNSDMIPRTDIIFEFREKEGTTLIMERQMAHQLNLSYDYVAAWITLKIHSSLDVVGLTALFSTELAENGISCNVVAAYYHDHIFVNQRDKEKAMEVLNSLQTK